MKQSDGQLQMMFVRATEEVVPPAPWLESHIADAIHQRSRQQRPAIYVGVFRGFGGGLRLTAGLVAVVLVIAAVAGLLMNTRLLHNPTVPGNKSTIQTPAFTPSPAVRAANWPPGGPVPPQLAGCWQPELLQAGDNLCLGGYSFDFGPDIDGNVVVNGSEIDFISDICTNDAKFGLDRYKYTISGDTLVLTRIGTLNCHWGLQRSFKRVAGQ